MKKFLNNWIICAFGEEVAKNPKGYAIILIATYLALC